MVMARCQAVRAQRCVRLPAPRGPGSDAGVAVARAAETSGSAPVQVFYR